MNAYNVSYSVKISHDVYLFIYTVCLFKKKILSGLLIFNYFSLLVIYCKYILYGSGLSQIGTSGGLMLTSLNPKVLPTETLQMNVQTLRV